MKDAGGLCPLADFGAVHQGCKSGFPKNLCILFAIADGKKEISRNCDELYWKIISL